MTPDLQHSLTWAAVGALMGALIAPLGAWLVYRIRSLPGVLTGNWLQEVMDGTPDEPGRVIKRDMVKILHVGDSVRGRITRVQPAPGADEPPRVWRFSGRYRNLRIFGHFWSLHEDNRSFGTISLDQAGRAWVGYYTRTERISDSFRTRNLRLEDHPLRWVRLTPGEPVPSLKEPTRQVPTPPVAAGARPWAIFDFDKTLFSRYAIMDFADFLVARAAVDSVLSKILQSLEQDYLNGALPRDSYVSRTTEEFYQGIKGLRSSAISELAAQYWAQVSDSAWIPGAKELLAELNGSHDIAIISGSPYEVLEALDLGVPIRTLLATRGVVHNGHFAGLIRCEYGSTEGKRCAMRELDTGALSRLAVAFGDSASDIPLLEAVSPERAFIVEHGQAHLDPELSAALRQNAWNHTTLPQALDRLRLLGGVAKDSTNASPTNAPAR